MGMGEAAKAMENGPITASQFAALCGGSPAAARSTLLALVAKGDAAQTRVGRESLYTLLRPYKAGTSVTNNIRKHLREFPGATPVSTAEALGLPVKRVTNVLYFLRKQGEVERVGEAGHKLTAHGELQTGARDVT